MDKSLDIVAKCPYICFDIFIQMKKKKSPPAKSKTSPEKKLKPYANLEESTEMDMVMEARVGLYSRPAYNQMVNYIDKNRMAELLHMSGKTLDRYKAANKKLNPQESEIVLKLEKLYKIGIEVFGNAKEFNEWLLKPSYGLYQKIPNELMLTSAGIDLVYEAVSRIAWGDIS
ncbi:MAG: DUF2384 domain-containing protein [Bacteroidia bacterium]|nr:DUF2384 domain-containing protein [Bacteroidia bacterium]